MEVKPEHLPITLKTEREALSLEIEKAHVDMLETLRAARPLKAHAASVEDREAEAKGLAADKIAHYEHLMRRWEILADEAKLSQALKEPF